MADKDLLRPGEDASKLDQIGANGITIREAREIKRKLGFQFNLPTFEGLSFKDFSNLIDPTGDLGKKFNTEVAVAGGQTQDFSPNAPDIEVAEDQGAFDPTPTFTLPEDADPNDAVLLRPNEDPAQLDKIGRTGLTVREERTIKKSLGFDFAEEEAAGTSFLEFAQDVNPNLADEFNRRVGELGGVDQPTEPRVTEEVEEEVDPRIAQFEDIRLKDIQTQATGTASQGALDFISGQGLDPSQFEEAINQAIQKTLGFAPTGEGTTLADISALFDPSGIAEGVLEVERGQRRKAGEASVSGFAPTGFAETLLPGTLDDAIIESILQEQLAPAQEQLRRSQSRRTLSDVGFNAANTALQNRTGAARTRLGQIGQGVLETGREQLRGARSTALEGARNAPLSSPFDISGLQTQVGDIVSGFGDGGFEGRFRQAFGGEQLFDVPSLVGQGGRAQGVFNPRSNLFEALVDRNKARGTSSRGLGTTGAF